MIGQIWMNFRIQLSKNLQRIGFNVLMKVASSVPKWNSVLAFAKIEK